MEGRRFNPNPCLFSSTFVSTAGCPYSESTGRQCGQETRSIAPPGGAVVECSIAGETEMEVDLLRSRMILVRKTNVDMLLFLTLRSNRTKRLTS